MIKSTLCVLNKDFQGEICFLSMLLCKQKDSIISRVVLDASGREEARPSSKTFTQQKQFIKKKVLSERSQCEFHQWEDIYYLWPKKIIDTGIHEH